MKDQVLYLAALSVLLASCTPSSTLSQPHTLSAYSSTGRPLDISQVKRIRIGHTTREELFALFGQPTNITEAEGGKTMLMWIHSTGGSATSLSFPATSAVQMNIQVLSIQMNHGRVAFYTFSPGAGTPINAGAIAR